MVADVSLHGGRKEVYGSWSDDGGDVTEARLGESRSLGSLEVRRLCWAVERCCRQEDVRRSRGRKRFSGCSERRDGTWERMSTILASEATAFHGTG